MSMKNKIIWFLSLSGLIFLIFALLAGILGFDPNNGWGLRRWLVLFTGISLFLASFFIGCWGKIGLFFRKIMYKKVIKKPWTLLNDLYIDSQIKRVEIFGSKIGVKGGDNDTIWNKLESLLISIIIITIVFYDVIFLGTTLTQNRALFPIIYEPDGITATIHHDLFYGVGAPSGESDNGAIRWQEEPGLCYMNHLLKTGESPFWDPYSAGGMPGVETMTDIKFSPISMVMAILGCNIDIYNKLILLFHVIALYFLIRLLRKHFGFSRLTAVLGVVVYLLNGFYIMNINSQVVQNWLFFPICLYLLIDFCKKPSVIHFIWAIIGNMLIFSITFMPTTTLLLVGIYIISFLYTLNHYPLRKKFLIVFCGQLLSGVAAVFLLSFIYLPMYESFTIPHIYDHYFIVRSFIPLDFNAFLSFFSGKHFVSSLQYLPRFKTPSGGIAWFFGNDRIFYFGLIASFVMIQTWVNKFYRRDPIIVGLTMMFIFGLGRLFEFPIIYQLWDITPIIKTFAGPYVWVVPSFCVVFLVCYGFETFTYNQYFKRWPSILIFCTLLIYWFGYAKFWLIDRTDAPVTSVNTIYISILISLFVISTTLFFLIQKDKKRVNLYRLIFAFLIFGELFFYMNGNRPYRANNDDAKKTPAIDFLKQNLGLNRLANYGWTVWPQMGTAYQIQQIEGENLGPMPWYTNLFNTYLGGGHPLFPIMDTGRTNIDQRVMSLLGVKYIVIDKAETKYIDFYSKQDYPIVYQDLSVTIFGNNSHFDKIFIRHTLTGETFNPELKLDSVVTTDDADFLSLGKRLKINSSLNQNTGMQGKDEKISIIRYNNNHIVFNANLKTPGIVVLMDTWHPNWTATINGNNAYIGRVYNAFRGLALPAGDFSIEMNYEPKTLPIAIFLVCITFLSLIGMVVFNRQIDNWLFKKVNS